MREKVSKSTRGDRQMCVSREVHACWGVKRVVMVRYEREREREREEDRVGCRKREK